MPLKVSKVVNFPNGRTDEQGHETLESKNSTKYKQYLDLLLRWICNSFPHDFIFWCFWSVNSLCVAQKNSGYVSWDALFLVWKDIWHPLHRRVQIWCKKITKNSNGEISCAAQSFYASFPHNVLLCLLFHHPSRWKLTLITPLTI